MKEKLNLDPPKDNMDKERGKRETGNFTNKNQTFVVSPAAVWLFLSNYQPQDKYFA